MLSVKDGSGYAVSSGLYGSSRTLGVQLNYNHDFRPGNGFHSVVAAYGLNL